MDIDLKDWVLVITESGKGWLGKLGAKSYNGDGSLTRCLLLEALSCVTNHVQMPNGQQGWMRSLWPIEIAHGIQDLPVTEITVTPATRPQDLSVLDGSAATEMKRMIAGALELRQQARAARSGIVMAGAVPRN